MRSNSRAALWGTFLVWLPLFLVARNYTRADQGNLAIILFIFVAATVGEVIHWRGPSGGGRESRS